MAVNTTLETLGGDLSGAENYDLIAIDLVAGQSYSFSYRGTVEGGIQDPYLALFGPGFAYITEDDDGGIGVTSQITYTATASGTYYLYATSWYTLTYGDPSIDTGDYTIAVWSPDPANDAPGTFAGAVTIGEGTEYAYLETSTDIDMYRIEADAGELYSITFAGGTAGASDLGEPGSTVGILTVFDENYQLVAQALNYETATSFFAEEAGTYYVQVSPYLGLTGGYTLDVDEIDIAEYDPIDSLIWASADNVSFTDVDGTPTAYVYFAPAGVNYGETGDDGVTPMTTYGWEQFQIDGVMSALEQYEQILGVNYEITTDDSEATFRLLTTESTQYGAYFLPQDPAYGDGQGIGVFNLLSGGFTLEESLVQGGYSYAVVLHEFGHAHGLAHPHDRGGGSEVMLGVAGSASLGVFDLNQGVYTVMSYNDGWETNPDGALNFTLATLGYGWSGTLSAFDIAALQRRYGVHESAEGDDVYVIGDANEIGTYYSTIWDTGGNDTIQYNGSSDAQIDLLAATLDYSPTGGGVVSFAHGIYGGYTIANGVVIENATGGSGDDILIGNAADNVLTGNAGSDTLLGREGDDTFVLDAALAGTDTVGDFVTADTLSLTGIDGANVVFTQDGDDVVITVDGNAVAIIQDTLAAAALSATDFDGSPATTALSIDGDTFIASVGTGGSDNLVGSNKGTNLFLGGEGDDQLLGKNEDDFLIGNDGDDVLKGQNGNDQLFGGEGDDLLLGGNGDDILSGDNGDDFLISGKGNDLLSGGAGSDTFVFEAFGSKTGVDTVTDYDVDEDFILLGSDASSVAFTDGAGGAELIVNGNLVAIFEGVAAADMAGEYGIMAATTTSMVAGGSISSGEDIYAF